MIVYNLIPPTEQHTWNQVKTKVHDWPWDFYIPLYHTNYIQMHTYLSLIYSTEKNITFEPEWIGRKERGIYLQYFPKASRWCLLCNLWVHVVSSAILSVLGSYIFFLPAMWRHFLDLCALNNNWDSSPHEISDYHAAIVHSSICLLSVEAMRSRVSMFHWIFFPF